MMQNRCNGYHVIGGSCSCGWYYDNNNNPNNSFSMMFSPVQNHYNNHDYNNNAFVDREETDTYEYQYQYQYQYASSSPSSSVDCTLSLGTPSTRLSSGRDVNDNHHAVISDKKKPKFFSWNFLQPSSNSKSHDQSSSKSTNRTAASNYSNSYSGSNGGDSGAARRCANCDTSSTPLWRNGPKGPKSLCNACGIRYKKEEKRAAAAAANSNSDGGNAAGAVDGHHVLNSSPWVHHSQNQMMPCISSVYSNEFSFIEDIDDSGNPFLYRRLNVH